MYLDSRARGSVSLASTSPALLMSLGYPTGSENSAAYPESEWLSLTQLSLSTDANLPTTSPIHLFSKPPFSVPVQSTALRVGVHTVHVSITSKAQYNVCTV